MAGSGGSSSATSMENRYPYYAAVPHIDSVMNEATRLYDNNIGNQVYDKQRVANLDPMFQKAMQDMLNTSAQMPSMTAPINSAMSSIATGGRTKEQNNPLATLLGISSGQNSIGTGGQYGDIYKSAQGQTAADQYGHGIIGSAQGQTQSEGYAPWLMNQARGPTAADRYGTGIVNRAAGATSSDQYIPGLMGGMAGIGMGQTSADQYLPEIMRRASQVGTGQSAADQYLTSMASGADAGKNPYLTDMLDANAARIGNRASSAMSGAGRYGSAAHTDVLARSIAEANNPLLAQAYESDQNRRLAATGQIDASRDAMSGRQLQGMGIGLQGAGQMDASRDAMTGRRLQATGLGMQGAAQLDQARNAAGALGLQGAGLMDASRNAAGLLGLQGAGQADQTRNAANLTALQGMGLLDQSRMGMLDRQLGATAGLTDVQGRNIANQRGAAGDQLNQFNINAQNAQKWASLIPGLMEAAYIPADRTAKVGLANMDYQQRMIDADRERFNEGQLGSWQNLARRQAIINGLPIGNSGTTQKTGEENKTASWNDLFKFGSNVGSLF